MAKTFTDDEIDELLGQGRICGPKRDAIWDNISRKLKLSQPSRSWARSRVWGLAIAAGVLVVAGLSALQLPKTEHFVARGSSRRLALEIGCQGQCAVGKRLLFAVSGVREPSYFVAYAVSPSGRRVDYFPGTGEAAPLLTTGNERQVLPRAIVLGPEHSESGVWQLHVLLSRHLPADAHAIEANEVIDEITQALPIGGPP